mgnify:CR=1 FL=1
MGDDTVTFTIKDISRDDWDNFVSKIDRKFYNEKISKFEDFSIEEYFRRLIKRLSKLDRDDFIKIINNHKLRFE